MAAGTVTSLIGLGISGAQTISSINEAGDFQEAIDNFKPQQLRNPFKEISLDTAAAELQTQANLQNVATGVDALQRGGARSVVAGVPRLTESSLVLQERISADLSRQERERDILIAQGEQRIQEIEEQREREILAGLGQGLSVARNNISTGIQDTISSGLALESSLRSNNNSGTGSSVASSPTLSDLESFSQGGAEGFLSIGSSIPSLGSNNPLIINS